MNSEPKDEVPQNNISEASASITYGPNIVDRSKSVNPSIQQDSEGMNIEE